MQRSWLKSLRGSMRKRLKKYSDKKKKRTKGYSQENYQRGLQLKSYRGGQIRNTRDRGRENGKRTKDNRKIPWNKET